MKYGYRLKRVSGWTSLLLILIFAVSSLSGCGMLDGNKGLLDTVVDALTDGTDSGTSEGGGLIGVLFDAFLGGSSSDFGWGDSSYSGGEDNYIGNTGSTFQYADVDSLPAGNGKATVMFYCIGSNLESANGAATLDFQEMVNAGLGDNVNLIIEAGGAKKWQNSVMASEKTGRYRILSNGIQVLEEAVKKSMVETSEVKDFVKYCTTNYPADRYAIIFWDHGGGTLAGFGTDELFQGNLSIDGIASALSSSGTHFDFVGFDACLMGTVETAYSLKGCSDYLIAAEEEEPGHGWYYTGWLKALNKNPSLDTEKLGSIIVDDFVASNSKNEVTLSVVDLKKIDTVYEKMAGMFSKGNESLYSGGYAEISKARKNTKAFGENHFDQIDIIDFCEKSGIEGAGEVADAVKAAVVYHKTNMGRTNGLAMYFPFDYPSYYKMVKQTMKSVEMDNKSYSGFFENLLSVRAGGAVTKAASPMEAKTGYEEKNGKEDYSNEEWFNAELAQSVSKIDFELDEDGLLLLTETENGYLLPLSDKQREAITFYDLGLFVDTGDGYMDLGNDNVLKMDENGNLNLDFSYNWVAINENVVPFYAVEEGEMADGGMYTYGVVNAILTSARTGETHNIEILVYWDSDHDGGYVKGYRTASQNSEGIALAERNVVSFIKGDKIQFTCSYYTYDGEYEADYKLGEEITVDALMKVTYEFIGDYPVLYYGHILDIFGNNYSTQFVKIS